MIIQFAEVSILDVFVITYVVQSSSTVVLNSRHFRVKCGTVDEHAQEILPVVKAG